MSYVPEDRQGMGIYMDLTLRDNLCIRKYYKEPFSKKGLLQKDKISQYAEELVERYHVRTGQGLKTTLRFMSGGKQQKVIIAREIEENAKLAIFVQPTRGLDIGAIENIRSQILRSRDSGAAVLLVSLELDEIMQLADTIGIIYGGEMVKIADASTMTLRDVGKYMMGVREE